MLSDTEERKMEFLFCRTNFLPIFASYAKDSFYTFLNELQTDTLTEKQYIWAFGDIGQRELNSMNIIFGRLGKTITEKFETIYDKMNHSYRKEVIRSREAAYSNFFVVNDYQIIAFEVKNILSKNQFLNAFRKFWKTRKGIDVDFEYLIDEGEIFDIINTWDQILSAKFNLVPSNPVSGTDWKDVDEILKKAKAKRAKMEFKNEEDGLARNDSIIQKGIMMASSGYGEFKLKGRKDDAGQTIDSESKIIRKEIHTIDDLEIIAPRILREIINLSKKSREGE